MKINKNTVTRWLKRYKETNKVYRNKGSGRKRKINKETEKCTDNNRNKRRTYKNERNTGKT